MLKQRIIATLHFFALQDIPLTLFELHKYLLADLPTLKHHLNSNWEVADSGNSPAPVTMGDVLACLEGECPEVRSSRGFYYLEDGGQNLVSTRIQNYMYGIYREQIIKRYTGGLRYIPFLRSIGLVGSQALGLNRQSSDIDVLIIVEPGFMWLTRFFVTAYFQLAGVRRHGNKIADRFCLNHYIAGTKILSQDRNAYTASEYAKARPVYHGGVLGQFKEANLNWMKLFFPNLVVYGNKKMPSSRLKRAAEKIFNNSLGRRLEGLARAFQLRRIKRGEFVIVEEDELSFHPDNRKAELFTAFFEHQQEKQGKAV